MIRLGLMLLYGMFCFSASQILSSKKSALQNGENLRDLYSETTQVFLPDLLLLW